MFGDESIPVMCAQRAASVDVSTPSPQPMSRSVSVRGYVSVLARGRGKRCVRTIGLEIKEGHNSRGELGRERRDNCAVLVRVPVVDGDGIGGGG